MDPRRPQAAPQKPPDEARELTDLWIAGVLVLVGALAAAVLPAGDVMRIALVAPVVLVVPGYLLVQAFVVPAVSRRRRAVHALIGLGLSPVVVGLLALVTALVPGGFQTSTIILFVTLGSLGLGVAAGVRRRTYTPKEEASGAPPTSESGRRKPGGGPVNRPWS